MCARHDGIRVQRPASGLVTALEPVMRACSGTWIAHGSGSADRETVDRNDRVAVPPDKPRYNIRRIWLSEEEEAGYYAGFANEGLWPLCHIAHVRPDVPHVATGSTTARSTRVSPTPWSPRRRRRIPSCWCRTTTSRCCRG